MLNHFPQATLQQRLEKCRTVAAASTSHAASNKENEVTYLHTEYFNFSI